MKLTSFRTAAGRSWGVIAETGVIDVGIVLGARYPDLKSAIAAHALEEIDKAAASAPRHPQATIDWLPPIPNPTKILCIGLNYETHRKETGRPDAAYPTIFARFADTQIGHRANIIRPHVSTALDYEGELAVIIGRGGRYIAAENAMGHVAGYACYNDATLRDWQRHTHQFTPGKNFPGTGAFGPFLLTSDVVPDYRAFHLRTRVNGEVVQEAGLDQLIFPIPELIAYCSAFTPLLPGDVLVTGTPGGVGAMRTPTLYLRPGDTVDVEISGLGTLSNGVADES
jgi:2-keto-4-pentenoate hydratase/2-oxohepta-3-ene-1,7-dioic acid hydratase in catechol pathway